MGGLDSRLWSLSEGNVVGLVKDEGKVLSWNCQLPTLCFEHIDGTPLTLFPAILNDFWDFDFFFPSCVVAIIW